MRIVHRQNWKTHLYLKFRQVHVRRTMQGARRANFPITYYIRVRYIYMYGTICSVLLHTSIFCQQTQVAP